MHFYRRVLREAKRKDHQQQRLLRIHARKEFERWAAVTAVAYPDAEDWVFCSSAFSEQPYPIPQLCAFSCPNRPALRVAGTGVSIGRTISSSNTSCGKAPGN